MFSPSRSLRTRFSAVALVLVFISVVVGLYLADRALRRADLIAARTGADEIAASVEDFLTLRMEALSAFHVLYAIPTGRGDRNRFGDLVDVMRTHLGTFRQLWLLDSSGVSLQTLSLLDSARAAGLPVVDSSTWKLIKSLAIQARQTGRSYVESIRGSATNRDLLAVQPVRIDGRIVGFVVGAVRGDSLQSVLLLHRPSSSGQLLLLAGSDTLVRISSEVTSRSTYWVATAVSPPGGSTWSVAVERPIGVDATRIWLWTVGLGALVALALALFLERREASRIADRSRELEHLSTELLRANRAKSEFLANVSHELRTPLNAIVGFVDLLRDGVYGELMPRQAGPVERIEASANHLRHLVDQILDIAKMAAGRLEVHTEPIDLRPFVFDVASEVESLINEKGLNLSLAVGASLPRVRTDPTHLRQILINLLGNAIKFTPEGSITVRGRLVGDNNHVVPTKPRLSGSSIQAAAGTDGLWVALQVADSGIGIPEKDRERIFDEFEQVNAGPRGDSIRRGTGLGLSISRRLAKLLGGDISVDSEVGRGSVFTVWLPVDPADVREHTPAKGSPLQNGSV